MAKQILFSELAQVVATLISRPEVLGELDELDVHERFVEDIACVVADHCGGLVNGINDADEPSPHLDLESRRVNPYGATVSISPNESLPSLYRNVWSLFDPEELLESGGADIDEGTPMSVSEQDLMVCDMSRVLSTLAAHNPVRELRTADVLSLMAEHKSGEHPRYPRQDWLLEVENGNTLRGYWEYVANELNLKEARMANSDCPEVYQIETGAVHRFIRAQGDNPWQDHPLVTRQAWVDEVGHGHTVLGYWQYVMTQSAF